LGIIYGGFFGLIAIIGLPMFLLAPPPTNGQPVPRGIFLAAIVFYPLMGLIAGWIFGHIIARLYNFVAARFGGLRYETEDI
jgi:hypothetical protein